MCRRIKKADLKEVIKDGRKIAKYDFTLNRVTTKISVLLVDPEGIPIVPGKPIAFLPDVTTILFETYSKVIDISLKGLRTQFTQTNEFGRYYGNFKNAQAYSEKLIAEVKYGVGFQTSPKKLDNMSMLKANEIYNNLWNTLVWPAQSASDQVVITEGSSSSVLSDGIAFKDEELVVTITPPQPYAYCLSNNTINHVALTQSLKLLNINYIDPLNEDGSLNPAHPRTSECVGKTHKKNRLPPNYTEDDLGTYYPRTHTDKSKCPATAIINADYVEGAATDPISYTIKLENIDLTGLKEGDNRITSGSVGKLTNFKSGEHIILTIVVDEKNLISGSATITDWSTGTAGGDLGSGDTDDGLISPTPPATRSTNVN